MSEPARFTPAWAERYAEETLPGLFREAAAHLGEPYPDGAAEPEPSGRIARLAIQSAHEILEQVGALLSDDSRVPLRAELARLVAAFEAKFPGIDVWRPDPLNAPPAEPTGDLKGLVADALSKLDER